MALSLAEQQELTRHEATIERQAKSFAELGAALKAIRDDRLYKQTHQTFEAYCRERWGLTASYARYQIQAEQTLNNLATIVAKPQTESQCRPLTKLKSPEEQREAWNEVVHRSEREERPITAKLVSEVVEGSRSETRNPKTPTYNNLTPVSSAKLSSLLRALHALEGEIKRQGTVELKDLMANVDAAVRKMLPGVFSSSYRTSPDEKD